MIVYHHSKIDILIIPGNYHNQMSSLGAIGYLTKNTGLLEALQTIYREHTTKAILSGKTTERVYELSAHGWVATALKEILLEQILLEDEYTVTAAKEYFDALIENSEKTAFNIPDCPIVDSLVEVLDKARDDLSSTNPTNKIFFMYLDWYDSLLNNLHAERMGLWDKYVSSLKGMTPFQAAGGRRSYTKCNKWFLDVIEDLDDETKSVLENGGFVVWRSEEPYGAVSPDLNTEQTLKDMTGYKRYIGQGSVKPLRDSRLARDCSDVSTLKTFFNERLVFDRFVVSNTMKSIASGVIAPSNVDIHCAYSKGVQCMKGIEGSNPITVKIPKTALCVQMPSTAVYSRDKCARHKQKYRCQFAFSAKLGSSIESRQTCHCRGLCSL